MRVAGTVAQARGFGPHDHLCLAYDDPAEFRTQARQFLSEGLAQGQRVRYVADGDLAALRDELSGLDGRPLGAVQVETFQANYRTEPVFEPREQVRSCAAATAEALADGFSGFRLVADVTALVRPPRQLGVAARYEHLLDCYMVRQPFSALCAYDRTELGTAAVAQVACMHPAASEGAAPFRLYAMPGASAALGGELDVFSIDLFRYAAERADLTPVGGEVVLDGSKLTFVDHRGLLALAELGQRSGATVVLRTPHYIPRRLAALLDLKGVRVE